MPGHRRFVGPKKTMRARRVRPYYFCGLIILATMASTAPIDLLSLSLLDEPDSRQFVLRVGEYRVRQEYDRDGDRIFLGTLDVPRPIESTGVAEVMMEKTLTWVEENGLKLIPTHPTIKGYLRKHTAWQRLLLKGVQV